MSRSIILLGLVSALAVPAAARTTDRPAKGLASVNVPIVTRAEYALDLAAPDGAIAAQEAALVSLDAAGLRRHGLRRQPARL